MKNLEALTVLGTLLAGSTLANRSTTNECWVNEGATYLGQHFDLFFDYADSYRMDPANTCNVFTYSTSQVTWNSNDLEAFYWQYYTGELPEEEAKEGEDGSAEDGDDDFSDFKKDTSADTVLQRTLRQEEVEEEKIKIEGPPEGHEKLGLPDYCLPTSEIPQEYGEGTTLKTTGNFCGYKI